MLEISDQDIDEVAEALAAFGVDAGYLVPTATGLGKSIMDAHAELRSFLSLRDLHDFESQPQGPDHKVVLSAQLVGLERVEDARVSLYRPVTKKGDPRIWITGLPAYAEAGNLLALITDGTNRMYVVNCSDDRLFASRNVEGSPLNILLTDAQQKGSAEELLGMLRGLSSQGFVAATGHGDHTVGDTLEALLGIETNTRNTADYKGIEIKSGRKRGKSRRKQIFGRNPDWSLSPITSARELVDRFGWWNEDKERMQLYCTVTSRPNAQGFFLSVNQEDGVLEHRIGDPSGESNLLLVWSLTDLDDTLVRKHPETFWIEAESDRHADGTELFWYRRVVHTKAPLIGNLRHLLSTGRVSFDWTLYEGKTGKIDNHGYNFKIKDGDIHLLFSDPVEYEL